MQKTQKMNGEVVVGGAGEVVGEEHHQYARGRVRDHRPCAPVRHILDRQLLHKQRSYPQRVGVGKPRWPKKPERPPQTSLRRPRKRLRLV